MMISKYKIVIGKGPEDRRKRRYIQRTQEDGVITYHPFKEKVHRWSTKYGPYNTIKQKAGEARFYNLGEATEIQVIQELNIEIEATTIALGYRNIR